MTASVATPARSGVERWQAAFQAAGPGLPGAHAPWLAALRRRSMERFVRAGWPTHRLERWRHTSLAFLDQIDFDSSAPRAGATPAGEEQSIQRLRDSFGGAGHWYAFVDGKAAPGLSQPGKLPSGVVVTALSQLADGRHERADEALQALFDDPDAGEVPASLNAAFAGDGAVIRVGPGVVVSEPIHLVFVAAAAGRASHLRNLIFAAEGARLTVVEHYIDAGEGAAGSAEGGAASGRSDAASGMGGAASGGGDASAAAPGTATLTNTVTRIRAGADARVTHIKLQQESATAIHLATVEIRQGRASCCESHSMSFGARLARNDIEVRMEDENCDILLNGLYHVDARRHVDHHTSIRHEKPGCSSREFYRGVLDGASRGVFTGRISVAPGAVRTDAIQRSDSLLLSPLAETDARPELEIYTDDVKCAHGATVGQIDEDSLFYLRSRGFDPAHARNTLVHAFAVQALDRIDIPAVRGRVSAALRDCLPGAPSLEDLP